MKKESVWLTKRKGKKRTSYCVRWFDPNSGTNCCKTFYRKDDALEFKVKTRKDILDNNYFSPSRMTFDQWRAKHIENLENSPETRIAVKTIASHKEALDSLALVCKPKRLIDVDPKMIRLYRSKQMDTDKSPNTINKNIRTIRSALSYAVRSDYLQSNKLLGPHRFEIPCDKTRGRTLEVGELVTLMNVLENIKQRAFISLAGYHGLCTGEMCWLRWQDIDLQEYRLEIVTHEDHKLKTNNSSAANRTRSIALRKETAELLQELYWDRDKTNEYIFGDPQYFYNTYHKWFKRLVKKAKLDHCSMHDLRKTCNTMMKDQGNSEEVVLQIIGNTSEVNRKHYTSTLKQQQRLAVDSLPSFG